MKRMTIRKSGTRGVLWMLAAASLAAPAAGQSAVPQRVSLGEAIDVAVANNLEISQVEASLRAADGQVREAWASVFPELRATATYTRNFQVLEQLFDRSFIDPSLEPILVRFGADNEWQAALSFSQPLFSATAFIGVSAAGKFQALQTEQVRGVTQNVVTAVRLAYFDVLLALEEVRLTERSVDRVSRTLDETRALNRAGLTSDYDVLRLEVQIGNLVPNLRRARDGVLESRRTLAILMGLDAETPLEVEGRLHEMNVADLLANSPENRAILVLAGAPAAGEAEFEDAYARAMDARTDLRQTRLNIQLERARYAVERAEFFPKVTLFSNYAIRAQQDGGLNFFGDRLSRSTAFSGGVRVELPIFTGFSRTARMSQARANVERNEALLMLTERRASNQIRTLLASVGETRQRVDGQQRAVEQARRGFEIASAEYRAGIGSQLQITDAEVALRESEFNYAQAVYDYLTARANLDAARGTVPDRAQDLGPLQTN